MYIVLIVETYASMFTVNEINGKIGKQYPLENSLTNANNPFSATYNAKLYIFYKKRI